MGWTGMHREKGTPNAEIFPLGQGKEYVATATVDNTFYGAMRDTETGVVSCLVILCRWYPNDYENFCYKELHEDGCPFERKAPAHVLDALTPTNDENALIWRQECRDRLDRKAKLAKAKQGDKVRLPYPLQFRSGTERQEFVLGWGRNRRGGRKLMLSDETGALYDVPNWREAATLVA